MKDSKRRNSLYAFFPVKDEPSFSHRGENTRVWPKYMCMCVCVCSWAGVATCAHACRETCLLPCLVLLTYALLW